MKKLAPDLFQRRFQDLVEMGRARLPALSPEWTDHNAHDPGITLMELLAWTTEAQLYSLSRMRRDERDAYAAMLGIRPAGVQPARGLIWPDRLDPNSPVATFKNSVVIPEDADIRLASSENPIFRPWCTLLWTPGQISKLQTRDRVGLMLDHVAADQRGGLPFLPFGAKAGHNEVFALTFHCGDQAGLFGKNRRAAHGALWPIGVLVPTRPGAIDPPLSEPYNWSPLTATLVSEDLRCNLKIAVDTTRGLLTTGVLLLDLDSVPSSPQTFTIEFRSTNGFPFPPRVLRFEPNVIPIIQRRTIARELHVANGLPNWSFLLNVPGLSFASNEEPVTIETVDFRGTTVWQRCDRTSDAGPHDFVYEFDTQSGKVTFGNGVNGYKPKEDSQVFVTYEVSDGAGGQVARNRKWHVTGVVGIIGSNVDAVTGGSDLLGTRGNRREARKLSQDDHALVSSSDIIAAARALPLLNVARAWVPAPDPHLPQTGVVRLVAMRYRDVDNGDETAVETDLWLETIRRRLVPRIPLGSRLQVTAPRYIPFSIQATLEAKSGRDPAAITKAVRETLNQRLALLPSPGITPRQPGLSLTHRDVAVWMRAIEGVNQVLRLQLQDTQGQSIDEVKVPASGLPLWDSQRSSIAVNRPALGRSR